MTYDLTFHLIARLHTSPSLSFVFFFFHMSSPSLSRVFYFRHSFVTLVRRFARIRHFRHLVSSVCVKWLLIFGYTFFCHVESFFRYFMLLRPISLSIHFANYRHFTSSYFVSFRPFNFVSNARRQTSTLVNYLTVIIICFQTHLLLALSNYYQQIGFSANWTH